MADDEESMRFFLARALERAGYEVEAFDSGAALWDAFSRRPTDAVLLDLKMPGPDGLEILERVRDAAPETVVVMMTAFGTVETAVRAMKSGAADYLTKPFDTDEMLLVLQRALERRSDRREVRSLRRFLDSRSAYGGLVGQSPAMRGVFQSIDALSQSSATVLLTGESGTGKELVARALHQHSPRATRPFVPLNCAAIPEGLIENELFGHQAGAFTGAQEHRHGHLLRADGGSLFLDEIGELSATVQGKLARFLEDRSFTPLGSEESITVDVRVIAATNRDLESEVAGGRFREELYWRLNVVPLRLPPLRERREDVPVLVAHFLQQLAERRGLAVPEFELEAMVALSQHRWPGNIRELQNTVERLVVLHPTQKTLQLDDLPLEIRERHRPDRRARVSGEHPYQEALEEFERAYLCSLFEKTEGNVTEAARRAGLSRAHLHRKIRQLGITLDDFRRTEPSDPGRN